MIKASFLLEDDGIPVFAFRSQTVFLATCECIIKTFESDGKHFDEVVVLEDASESSDHSLLYKLLELLWVGRCCAITESPNCLVFNLNIVVLQNLDEFVNNSCVDTLLNLLLSSGCDIGEYPA